jgi:chemotaxis protein MotA
MSLVFSSNFNFSQVFSVIDAPSAMIVIGGTIASTLIAFPMAQVLTAFKQIGRTVRAAKIDPGGSIHEIIRLANISRKEGLLALEEAANNMDDEFFKKSLLLIVDGTVPELVRSVMETELAFIEQRHADIIGVWDFMASLGPAYGMLGTIMGLIMMLQNMSDPSTIGGSMAIALITTFYGSLIANYLCLPVSNKLKGISADEIFIKQLQLEGALSIQAGENPRIIEEKLKSFLSPRLRNALSETKEEPAEAGESA